MRELQHTSSGEVPFPIKYYAVQPNRWTFQNEKIRRWVESHLYGRVLNACAGKTKLRHSNEIHRNDLNPERDAETHIDVCELSKHFGQEFDTVVYDPPFSQEQASSTYDGINVATEGQAIREIHKVLNPGGRVIKFGFSTTCMPGKLGYKRKEVAIFNTLGRMNDWLGVVDEKTNRELTEWQ